MWLNRKCIYSVPYITLGILIVLFLLTHTPNSIDFDAPSYINFDPIRPPLYPLFIQAFSWAGRYQFMLIVWMHAIITFSAMLYARTWLKKHLEISDCLIFIVFLATTFTILFHFQLMLIGAEGLTFPFFIWAFFLLIECFKEFNIKKILYLAILVSVIILTRLQFYYLYGTYIVLFLWYLHKRTPIKSLSIAASILSVSILLTCLIDRSYHYVKFGTFSPEPATGKLLLVQSLFLSTDNTDIQYIKDVKEKFYFKKMFTQIQQQKLNKTAALLSSIRPSYYESSYEEYNKNYITIFNLISANLKNETPNNASNISSDIAKSLFDHNTKKNCAFILWKFITFIGGVPLFLFFIIILSALPIHFYKKKCDLNYSGLFVSLIIFITFLNAATVTLFETYLVGYFCYTQFLFYCLAALIADRIFLK